MRGRGGGAGREEETDEQNERKLEEEGETDSACLNYKSLHARVRCPNFLFSYETELASAHRLALRTHPITSGSGTRTYPRKNNYSSPHTHKLRAVMAVSMGSMAMGRDTKWLTLEVCREFQRGTCSRSDAECKFAHPARSCHVENGRVIACFDSLKTHTTQPTC
ncbi:unnamed protein product [Coregonus sp. 'balchen']|nr:unnamed protein product [Coregonus sp. 'balchen']